MKLGVALFVTDQTDDVRDIAAAAEAAGFESFWVPEHTHIPTSRRTAYPLGAELPAEYFRTLDPFVALTAAAAATTRLRLGTGVCLIAERDPIVLAKTVASLDLISGGRLSLGIGAGWNVEEMADHGVDFAVRWDVMRERVGLMQRLWSNEVASYDGDHARLSPSWQWPKPVQRPLPVLVGGSGPRSMRHAVEYGDGWMPMPSPERLSDRLVRLRSLAEAAGRPVPPVTMYAARPDTAVIGHYAGMGVERSVFVLPPGVSALTQIAELAPLVAEVGG
jgi:probable F420-dependent oxidoreductase